MESFRVLKGIAAPLPRANVDTDQIIPKQFLKTIRRTGLARGLFYDERFGEDGAPKDDFILDRPPYDTAKILVAGDNFGCGSSREHAPWALLDFGIRAIIAPSFGDIFLSNCFKNGILPIRLAKAEVETLMAVAADAANPEIAIDLEKQEVRAPNGLTFSFEVDPFRKRCLIEGQDDIAITMEKAGRIDAFEAKQRAAAPWLFGGGG